MNPIAWRRQRGGHRPQYRLLCNVHTHRRHFEAAIVVSGARQSAHVPILLFQHPCRLLLLQSCSRLSAAARLPRSATFFPCSSQPGWLATPCAGHARRRGAKRGAGAAGAWLFYFALRRAAWRRVSRVSTESDGSSPQPGACRCDERVVFTCSTLADLNPRTRRNIILAY